MFYVPLYIEALRLRPVLVVWVAALAQAVLWILVPIVFYAAPPGDLPQVLAIGHEFPLRSDIGAPLAYWLAEIAFRAAGLFGVYALSQICVITTYWCVFALGRAIVGATHAAMAVLLMVGISVFTVPTPDFGPPVLAMALWAVVLLNYWRAMTQRQARSWYIAGCAAALILITTDAALILLGPLFLFTAATKRGRAALGQIEPRIVAVALILVLILHLFFLKGASDGFAPTLERLRAAPAAMDNAVAWLQLLGLLAVAHAGLAILVVLAGGWPRSRASPAPAITREPIDPFASSFVTAFTLLPALLGTIVAVLAGIRLPIGSTAPLLVLSGLAVVVAAGDSVELHHQRILGFAWAGLLLVPAIFVPIVLILLPWTTATDLKIAQPAAAMGRFFAESFQRRTGHPLAVVSGDTHTAALVALAAPSRPSVYFDADPARAPSVTAKDIGEKGAVIVWPTTATEPGPPSAIKAYFPDLVPEVPQTFERPVRGRLPPLRIGWGVIRPPSAPAAR